MSPLDIFERACAWPFARRIASGIFIPELMTFDTLINARKFNIKCI